MPFTPPQGRHFVSYKSIERSPVILKERQNDPPGKQIIWWYDKVRKPVGQNATEPEIRIFYRKIRADGCMEAALRPMYAKITRLGALRIGSIWEQGLLVGRLPMQDLKFSVDFTPNSWEMTSHHLSDDNDLKTPFDTDDYLIRKSDESNILDFPIASGKNLLIPCTEFFSRCYGRSQELKRLLCTQPMEHLRERLTKGIDLSDFKHQWPVRISGNLVNGDAIFLAHMLYDEFTRSSAKRIYSSLEATYTNRSNIPIYLRVQPWFPGKAQIRVQGYWVNNGQTFLGLNIKGMSEPKGVEIIRVKDARPATDKLKPDPEIEGGNEAFIPRRTPNKGNEPPIISGEEQPDLDGSTIDIQEEAFETLGEKRPSKSVKATSDNAGKAKYTYIDEEAEESYSSGEAQGSGKGVGKAKLYSPETLESNGMLRDIWNALLFLKKKYPKNIDSVEYFTLKNGYSDQGDPKLISLPGFPDKTLTQENKAILKWTYKSIDDSVTRGILVIRLIINKTHVHLVEIERKKTSLSENSNSPNEESLMGLVFQLKNEEDLENWILDFMEEIRSTTGKVRPIIAKCPGKADFFIHRKSNNDPVNLYTAAARAIEKMGFKLEENKITLKED